MITALFADLVGSTPLGEQLDAEEVKLVVGEAISRIVLEVERLGGHVKDLAGDGVLVLRRAGGLRGRRERAALTGLRIVDEMTAYDRGRVVLGVAGFGVRIDRRARRRRRAWRRSSRRVRTFGDTVNTAAWLQAAAEPGTSWSMPPRGACSSCCSNGTSRSNSTERGRPTFRPRSSGRARGGEAPRAGRVPVELVGRREEIAAAREAPVAARSGSGGVVFVTGEAGIGKSRLLSMRARRGGGRRSERSWLEGRCVSYGESLPYRPPRPVA